MSKRLDLQVVVSGALDGSLMAAIQNAARAMKGLQGVSRASSMATQAQRGSLAAQLNQLKAVQQQYEKYRIALSRLQPALNRYREAQTKERDARAETSRTQTKVKELQERLAELRKERSASEKGSEQRRQTELQISAAQAELKTQQALLAAKQREQRQASRDASSASKEYNQTTSRIRETDAALKAAGASTSKLGLMSYALAGRLREAQTAFTQYTQALNNVKQAGERHSQATNDLNNAWANMSNSISTAETLLAPFRASAETAMNYEAELSRSKALTQMDRINEGKTAEIARDMAMLDARYKEIGRTTQYSATEAARAGNYLAMAGFNAQQIDEGLASMVHLAIANNTELDRTADIFSNISTSMKIPNTAEGYKRLADRTTYLTTHSNQTLSMVDDTMKYVAPVASALDIELEDLYAAQKFMVDSGVRGSMAGTAMKSFLLRSVAPSKKTMEAMSEAGFMTPEEMNQNAAFQLMLQEENFELTNLPEGESLLMGLIRQYSEKSKDWSKEKKTSFVEAWAGKYAAPGVMAMLENGGYDKIQEFYKGLKGSDGAAAQTASVVADNTRGSWISLQSALEAASISIGQALLPTIRSALDSATNLTRSFSKLATENPALVQAFGLLLGAISATIVGLAAFRLALAAMNFASTSLELLKATSAFRATQSLIGASGILGTLGSTATAGAASTAGSTAGATAGAAARAGAASTAGSTAGAAARAGAAASGGGLMAKLAPMMKVGGWAAIGTSISSAFSNAFSTIVSKFGAVRAAITGIMSMSGLSMFGAAIKAAGGAFTTLIGAVTSLGSALRVVLSFTFSPLSMAILAVGAVISSVVSTVQSSWSELTQFFDAIGAQISNAFSSAAETLGPAIEQVSAAWANLQAAFGEDTALGQVIAQVQEAIGNGLVSAVMAAVQVFADFVTIGVSTFTVLLEVAINFATSLLNVFTAIFSGDIPGVLNSLLGVFSAVFNGAQAIATAALGAILSAVQAIAAAASSISFSSISGTANAAAAKAGAVGGHAEGGIFPKGAHLTWFAEDSAEAAIPIKRGDSNAISLWQRTGAMLGVLGGQQPSMPMPSMPSMPSMSNGYISDEMARQGTYSDAVRKSKTYESMDRARRARTFSDEVVDASSQTPSMMKAGGLFGGLSPMMSALPSTNGYISDEMARQIGTYSDAVRKSKTYENLDRARRARTFSDEVVEASSQTPSMMKAGGLFGGISPMMSALQSSNALQTSSESLSSKLQTYDQLEQQSMSLSTTTNNDQSMPPITLHFHFDGAVNREDVQKGVEESLPSIRETFEQQMAKYRHEVSRRSF